MRSDLDDRTLLITRVFDAPRDLLFDVWTSPEHLREWWGPRDFVTTLFEIDLRSGGGWPAA